MDGQRLASRLALVFAPGVALVRPAALLVAVAFLFAGHRAEMLISAAILTWVALLLAVVLLHRQVRRRQATGRAQQNAQPRVSDVVESTMDAIITVDENQRVVAFNAAAEKVFLWPCTAVIGEPMDAAQGSPRCGRWSSGAQPQR